MCYCIELPIPFPSFPPYVNGLGIQLGLVNSRRLPRICTSHLKGMTYSSFSMQEPQVLQLDYHPNVYVDSYDINGPYEEPPSFFDAICYPCPVLDPDSSLQERFFHGFIWKEEVDFTRPTEEAYDEGEQLPYSGCGNWLSEYDSCFGDYCCADNGYGSRLGEPEDSYESDGQFDSYISDYEDMENHPSYDYNPWCQSWFGYGGEEDSYEYDRQELKPAYSYSMDEVGICEGIFGYWPCMLRRDQITYSG